MDDIAQMNLRVLRRHNPLIESLIDKSSYSVIYTFSTASTSWTKAGYEGTLFIYSQQPHDIQTHTGAARGGRYGFCVLNRLNLENFWWEMDGGDVVLEDQIIIMRSLTGGIQPSLFFVNELEVYGLWLFEESDRTRIFDLLQRFL
jgi:Dcp1-like decapping family